MRITRSTDDRSTRPKAPRLRIAGVAVALAASSAVTAGAIWAIPPSGAVGSEPVCGVLETSTGTASTNAVEAFGDECDGGLRATYHLTQAWPQKWAGTRVASGEVVVEPIPDRAVTWTAIAMAESGGSTGT